jgi:hypothetical protein
LGFTYLSPEEVAVERRGKLGHVLLREGDAVEPAVGLLGRLAARVERAEDDAATS